MQNYSQNHEQQHILAAFADAPGRFLDIGAWHAKDKSNTRALFELGWTGVLIEPSPEPFAGLEAAYADDLERVVLLNKAVGFEPGERTMYVTADAVSTFDRKTYDKWRPHVAYSGRLKVQCITLEQIYAEYGSFDFVSIDAEGMSGDLMHRLFALGQFPRCICVEHDERTTELLSAATSNGYACTYANGENLVLVRQ
jgi:FkbM family methyltransferase